MLAEKYQEKIVIVVFSSTIEDLELMRSRCQ